MEDRQIVDLYWQRSDLAISETNQKYGRYCHTIAYNICGTKEDAEECVSDTWFRAWNLMPDRRPTVLSAFLGRITRNFAINLIQSKNRIKRGGGEAVLALDELEECIPGGTNPEQAGSGRKRACKGSRKICFRTSQNGEEDLHPAILVCRIHR